MRAYDYRDKALHQYAAGTAASCWPGSRNRYGNLIVQYDSGMD